jgi:hypothetical protein
MLTRRSTHVSRAVVGALSLAMLCLLPARPASAQGEPRNRRTTVSFNAPFEIPGPAGAMVLPPGTYVFKLLDTVNDRSVVQVFNKDESKLLSTILAIPNNRLKATDQLVMTFAERSAGSPQALKAWFCPGDKWGQEFVYPKAEALTIAAAAQEPVLYVPDVVKPATPPTEPPPPPLAQAIMAEPVKAVTPVGTDIPVTQLVEPPPVQTVPVLPKAAGDLPLLALLGVLSLAVGFSVRAYRCAH